MADFSIPITVPNAAVDEVLAALNWKFAASDGRTGTTMTPAEIKARLKQNVIDEIKATFAAYKAHLASQAAQEPTLPDIV